MFDLNRTNRPPAPGPSIWVRRVKANQSLTCLVLSTAIWECWVHWDGQRSSPHLRAAKQCPGCRLANPKKWRGYVHVINAGTKREEFLELTAKLAEQLLEGIPEGDTLRGYRIRIDRGSSDNSRLKFTLLAHHSKCNGSGELPEEKSPYDTLSELWGVGDISLGGSPEADLQPEPNRLKIAL